MNVEHIVATDAICEKTRHFLKDIPTLKAIISLDPATKDGDGVHTYKKLLEAEKYDSISPQPDDIAGLDQTAPRVRVGNVPPGGGQRQHVVASALCLGGEEPADLPACPADNNSVPHGFRVWHAGRRLRVSRRSRR